MTQLDLPQISFARYFDLLKRRRWQVIPVSVLGLLIGGLVAFLIPRYYVAETQISYKGVPGDEKTGTFEDPMAELVDSARLTIPLAVGETLRDLGWEGALVEDRFAAQEYERQVRTRVEVQDMGPDSPRRTYALLRVTYRDTDGERAARFLNRLVQIWIAQQLDSITQRADDALSLASDRIEKARSAFANAAGEVSDFERQYELNPQDRAGGQQGQRSALETERREIERQLRELERREEGLLREIAGLEEIRDRTPKKVPAAQLQPSDLDLMQHPQLRALAAELAYALQSLGRITPLHPNHELRVKQVAELTARIEELRTQLGIGRPAKPDEEVDNPDFLRVVQQVADKQVELEGVQSELAVVRRNLEALNRRLDALPAIWAEYTAKLALLEEARQALEEAQAEGRRMEEIRRRVNYEKPLEVVRPALVPPRPTEPNITLVALIGCVIGLGAAIGMILAVDFLQGTYKTVDDVERGLGVPVLGGLAYLETEEVRRRAVRTRRTVALMAGSFVVLVVVLVTIYYVDPARLPGFVRDALAVVLGEGGG